MTIGEFIRQKGDKELAALLLNWMLFVIATLGGDFTQMDLDSEYSEILQYLETPATQEMVTAFDIWDEKSKLMS